MEKEATGLIEATLEVSRMRLRVPFLLMTLAGLILGYAVSYQSRRR